VRLDDGEFNDPSIWHNTTTNISINHIIPMGTTSTFLVVIGIFQYLLNNGSNELLMVGIVLVRNFSKPTIYRTEDF